ncbi:MAG: hypothetical protein KA072_02285 [Thermoanaerobaculaceae bacterium]|nr:hypothetical protein [Thermoanaerobaculaceae bacterium]MDI9621544.1 acetyl-CoA carboxylase biotin carboxyl carrier protein subunit [Acidobacteriota bacterium]NLH11537.1 acetyl-CoA carboxylase biotin carboxyl carrier protein subunit [Holophagae bacterium]
MKKLRITVNNMVYDVTVQVLEDDEQVVTGAGFVNPVVPPVAPVRQPTAATPMATSPTKSAGTSEANSIASPIAGTVQKVFVEPGKRIDAKAPAFLLDAMKMDTYIYAPRSGTVAAVEVAVGDTVQVGQVLLRYRPED